MPVLRREKPFNYSQLLPQYAYTWNPEVKIHYFLPTISHCYVLCILREYDKKMDQKKLTCTDKDSEVRQPWRSRCLNHIFRVLNLSSIKLHIQMENCKTLPQKKAARGNSKTKVYRQVWILRVTSTQRSLFTGSPHLQRHITVIKNPHF